VRGKGEMSAQAVSGEDRRRGDAHRGEGLIRSQPSKLRRGEREIR
jgi:hypothetical protein